MSAEKRIPEIQKSKTSKLNIASSICFILCALSFILGLWIVPLIVLSYYLTGKVPGPWLRSWWNHIILSAEYLFLLGPLLFGTACVILHRASVIVSKDKLNK